MSWKHDFIQAWDKVRGPTLRLLKPEIPKLQPPKTDLVSRLKLFLTRGPIGACGSPKWQRLLGVVLAGGCSWCHNLGGSTSPDAVREEGMLADKNNQPKIIICYPETSR